MAENRVLFCACLVLALPVWIAGYEYSPTMKQMAQSGVRWSAEQLNLFLTAPTKVVPGTKMGFQGLLNETDRQAIISYLEGLKIQK